MFGRTKLQLQAEEQGYATRSVFCRVFQEDMKQLYLLAFLLTAEHEKAEKCFVAGLEDSISGNPVFKEWVRSWSRRMVIKNAIRVVAPTPQDKSHASDLWNKADSWSEEAILVDAVVQLAGFERFVFVMSVLERYSEHECAVLLNSSLRDVAQARAKAIENIAAAKLRVPGFMMSKAEFEADRQQETQAVYRAQDAGLATAGYRSEG